MARIIISNNYTQKTEGFSTTDAVDIGDIKVSINHKVEEKKQVFLLLKDSRGLLEVIELVQSGRDSNGSLYVPSLESGIRTKNGLVKCQVLIIDVNTATYKVTSSFNTQLSSSQYELARQIYLVKDFGVKVQKYYTKIVDLIQQLFDEKGEN